MAKVTITTSGENIHIAVETAGGSVTVEQPGLTDFVPVVRRNNAGEHLATEPQQFFLRKRGKYVEGMTSKEAFILIQDIKAFETERKEREKAAQTAPTISAFPESDEPLPWEDPLRHAPRGVKRGRKPGGKNKPKNGVLTPKMTR